jgi:isoprenylcysteine carboxyl methyltransferase (ICMT) family protein YpbQ
MVLPSFPAPKTSAGRRDIQAWAKGDLNIVKKHYDRIFTIHIIFYLQYYKGVSAKTHLNIFSQPSI